MTIDKIGIQPPADVSYKTFESFMIKLQERLPVHIECSFLEEMFSGSTSIQLMSAMRFLNLIDVKARPMPRLRSLVTTAHGEHRAALLRQIAYDAYSLVFKGMLDTQNTTYTELEDIFQNTYKMDSVSCRKCIKFFIEFSKDGSPKNYCHLREWSFDEFDKIVKKFGRIEWNCINGPYEGPFNYSSGPEKNTFALSPFIFK